ncbi:hypothetical protein V8D89_008968, partial [Ganoderma adspersum]
WLRLRLWFGCGWLCLHTEQARAVEVSGVRRDAFGRMMPRPRGNFGRYCPGQPGAGIPVKKLNILAPGLRAWGQGGRMLSTTLTGDRLYPSLLSSMGRDLAVAPDSMLLKIQRYIVEDTPSDATVCRNNNNNGLVTKLKSERVS